MLAAISAIVPSDEDFNEALRIARVPRAALARYMLIALEQGRIGDKEPEFVPNSNEEQVNLEHVLPKRASHADWGAAFTSDERKDYVNRLGNMALLQKGPNGRIGNKSFAAKKAILQKSKFELTKMIAAQQDWTRAAIAKRQAKLAGFGLKVWPR